MCSRINATLSTKLRLVLPAGWQVLFEGKLVFFEDNHVQYPLAVISFGVDSRVVLNMTSRGLTLLACDRKWTLRITDPRLAAEWCRALQHSITAG